MNGRSAIEFDESQWPRLLIRFNHKPSDAEFAAYLDAYERYLERPDRYGLILDVSPKVGMTPVSQARMQANWMKEHKPRLQARCHGVAFVLPSAVHRGVLKAILTMTPMPTAYAVHPSIEDADRWLNAQGLPRPNAA